MTDTKTASPASCRFCGSTDLHTFVDLGMSPLCETYLTADQLDRMEPFYPLTVRICRACLLVQLRDYVDAQEIFEEYAYFSSYSDSWLAHARTYSERMIDRFGLDADSFVVELASNDGYLLRNFVERGIPCLGIEPAANVAKVAVEAGVPTRVEFFGVDSARRLAGEGKQADLICGNNVLAQVPDLNDFVAGIKILLAPGGVVTIEWPHVLQLMRQNQFDTIYHEHFSYFSLLVHERIWQHHGMRVFDVEELPSHGGSLRVFGCHADDATKEDGEGLRRMRIIEEMAGIDRFEGYGHYTEQVEKTKHALLTFLIAARAEGKHIAGYGAPGKGNTLLNYCGIRTDLIDYLVDRNPYKHGRFAPGTHIPIFPTDQLEKTKPDIIVIMPWNLRDEIARQLAYTRAWGAQLVVAIPTLEIVEESL
ncbi:MAG: methyltransferase domain-containing protein [Rhodospirillaceae bacterium]|nr:methyltransferase domain-containing protein [Rhodospirillaceae bacterium]